MKRLMCIAVLAFVSGCQFPADFISTFKEKIREDTSFKETVADTFATMGANALTSGDLVKGLGLSAVGIFLGGGGAHYVRKNGRAK